MPQDDEEPGEGEGEGKGEAATNVLRVLLFAEAAVLAGGLPGDGRAGRQIRAVHGERQQKGQNRSSNSAAAALVNDIIVATPDFAA